ncbi:hypothetical protein [Actinomycetospora sp. CA-084318]|uniref:hypothetical protein n=1 Tax=Actinomycetospora sp. CA-084318 TaxID=3239892 RepID=UPI003D955724
MADAIAIGGTVLVALAVVVGLPWIAARLRRRGVATGTTMGPFEEMWHPAAARARVDIEVQQEIREPAPTPGRRLRAQWRLR